MDTTLNQSGQFYVTGSGSSARKIFLPDGYELAHYTLRRVDDGRPQPYAPVDGSVTPMQALPITTRLSDLQSHGTQQINQEDAMASSSAPNAFTRQSPYSTQTPNQQLHNIPIRGGPKSFAHRYSETRELSKRTQKRHAHSRDDDYTDVCGVYSPEKANPMTKFNHGKGEFCCPRCESSYTRPKTVKDHFPDCISKYGNPDSLRYTDHPSMASTKAFIQRRSRASREPSNVNTDGLGCQTAEQGQGVKAEEMNDALDPASLHAIVDSVSVDGGPHIKTEFAFGADIVHESIETPPSEPLSQSANLSLRHTSLQPTSAHSEIFFAQTPDWTRYDSSTPAVDIVPWSSWVRGSTVATAQGWTPEVEMSEAEVSEAEALEGATSEVEMSEAEGSDDETPKAETPVPSGDGLQGDGLDGYMDRRSVFSATPA